MSNFELIDDYLTNRLGEQERVSFEQRLGSDPALKADVDLQKHIVAGVKKTRAAELKAMLNNVPVGGGFSSGPMAGKIAAGVVAVGVAATSLYFFLSPTGSPSREPAVIFKKQTEPPASTKKPTEGAPVQQNPPATRLPLPLYP